VLTGVIDFIASDHSPCTPDLKVPELGDFQKAWGGISSLELGLSIIWTAGARYNITLSDLAQWLSTKPAQFAGVSGKGSISIGNDADIIAFDPEHVRQIDAAKLHHRNPVSPYNGKHLRGYVTHTWLRGTLIYQQGEFKSAPQGKFLNKGVRV
jgi:allantoinase